MKFNIKIGVVVSSAVLVLGMMAVPAMADPQSSQGGWYGQMSSYMSQVFTPEQHRQFMNSGAMQNLHNSDGMQQAMQSGDFAKMQELMNSDPALKEEIGQQNLDAMNQFMSGLQSQDGTTNPQFNMGSSGCGGGGAVSGQSNTSSMVY